MVQAAAGHCSRLTASQSLRGKPDCFSFAYWPPGNQHSAVSSSCPCLPGGVKIYDNLVMLVMSLPAGHGSHFVFLLEKPANTVGSMPVDMVAFMGPMMDLGMELRCSIW